MNSIMTDKILRSMTLSGETLDLDMRLTLTTTYDKPYDI